MIAVGLENDTLPSSVWNRTIFWSSSLQVRVQIKMQRLTSSNEAETSQETSEIISFEETSEIISC